MTKYEDTTNAVEELIDLGAASTQTKGIGQAAQDTVQGQLQFPPSGLYAD